jgi:hypothetical protein
LSDAHAAPGPLPPPPPRGGHGCLWGCLIAVLIVAAAVIGSCSYLGWFWTTGFKNDASLKTVVAVLNADPAARAVLGDHIKITEVSSFSIESNLSGRHESFVAAVTGSKASGQIATEVNSTPNGKANIISLVLTGPDGHRYVLTGAQPQAPPSDTSI